MCRDETSWSVFVHVDNVRGAVLWTGMCNNRQWKDHRRLKCDECEGREIQDIQFYVHMYVCHYVADKWTIYFLKEARYGLLFLYYRKYTADPIFLPQICTAWRQTHKTRRNISPALCLAAGQKLTNANFFTIKQTAYNVRSTITVYNIGILLWQHVSVFV